MGPGLKAKTPATRQVQTEIRAGPEPTCQSTSGQKAQGHQPYVGQGCSEEEPDRSPPCPLTPAELFPAQSPLSRRKPSPRSVDGGSNDLVLGLLHCWVNPPLETSPGLPDTPARKLTRPDEVAGLVHLALEELQPDDGIDDGHEEYKQGDVEQGLHGLEDGVEDHLQAWGV